MSCILQLLGFVFRLCLVGLLGTLASRQSQKTNQTSIAWPGCFGESSFSSVQFSQPPEPWLSSTVRAVFAEITRQSLFMHTVSFLFSPPLLPYASHPPDSHPLARGTARVPPGSGGGASRPWQRRFSAPEADLGVSGRFVTIPTPLSPLAGPREQRREGPLGSSRRR